MPSPIDDAIMKIDAAIQRCVQKWQSMSANDYFVANPIDIQTIFDEVVTLISPTPDFKISEEVSIKYLPHLASRSGIRFTEFVLDSKTEATTLKDLLAQAKGVKFEGWNETTYLFLKSCHLLKLVVEMNITAHAREALIPSQQVPLREYKQIALEKLKEELAITVEAAKNLFQALKLTQTKQPIDKLVGEIAEKIGSLNDEQEYVLAAGGGSSLQGEGGHAIYVAFRRQGAHVIIRVDNRGYGIDDFYHYRDQGKVQPKLLARAKINSFTTKDSRLIAYLTGIIENVRQPQAKKLEAILADGAYNVGALGLTLSPSTERTPKLIERKEQKVGNCVVQSWELGSLYRLGLNAGDVTEHKALYKMQKSRERYFAVDFDHHLKELRASKKLNPISPTAPFVGGRAPFMGARVSFVRGAAAATSEARDFSYADVRQCFEEALSLMKSRLFSQARKLFDSARQLGNDILDTTAEDLSRDDFSHTLCMIDECNKYISLINFQERPQAIPSTHFATPPPPTSFQHFPSERKDPLSGAAASTSYGVARETYSSTSSDSDDESRFTPN